MDINARLTALAARPKTHRVSTRYACGKVRTFDAHSAAAADNFATGERRKVGRDLIDRESGATVRVVAVDVAEL